MRGPKTVPQKSAYEAALHLIAYRAQSEREIRTKLAGKGYGEEEIEETVSRLLEAGYLNDEELAEEIFSFYRAEGAYGTRYIRQKLKSRGLPSDFSLTEEEEEEKAARALSKKFAVRPALAENREKAAAFLFRRGFTSAAISSAIGNEE